MFSSRGAVRYEERGQGYRDVEKVGKHWSRRLFHMSVKLRLRVSEKRVLRTYRA